MRTRGISKERNLPSRRTGINPRQRLTCAITAILGGSAAGYFHAAPAASTNTDIDAHTIPEITVTAQRRSENMQDVPITIQALTGETLSELNVQTLDEFIKFLPNVTQFTNGPAQGDIYMRGLSVTPSANQGLGSTGFFPGVGVYLDEQSAQLPGRNLDIYAADLERIEVLEGPQGTLFGGGAESGVLRYITNKPKLNVTEGSVDAGYGITAHGDPNSNVTAVINIPIIDDTLAARGVIYNDSRGGYINNVAGTFARSPADLAIVAYNNGVVPTNSVAINNNNLVANAINPVTYKGFRLSALYKISSEWDALLTQSYQSMDSQGVFYQMPHGTDGATIDINGVQIGGQPLPPLSVNLFAPSYDKDKFENTALVINGRIGDLKLVYSGSYLVRNIDQSQDLTSYSRSLFGDYYQCVGFSPHSAAGAPGAQCYSPLGTWAEIERNTHQSQELRLSTPENRRVRALVGVFWEDYKIYDQTDYLYTTVPPCTPTGLHVNCFLDLQPWPGAPANNPNIRNPTDAFFDDFQRGYKQLAEYISLDVDLIPKTLTLTGGIRHFKYDNTEVGGDVGGYGCLQLTPTTYFGPCRTATGTNLTVTAPNRTTPSGNKGRVNLSWHVTDNDILYYTWSQGFRPGIFNRTTSCHLPVNGIDQYCIPPFTTPDTLTNNEVGWKTEWFNRRVQFNGSIYQENWVNVQTGFFDPQGSLGNVFFNTNGPSYRIRGFEPSIVARVTRGLSTQVAASWNSSSQTNSPTLLTNNPQSPAYGQPITSEPNPYGPVGSPTAFSPAFKISARARYEWNFSNYNMFVQVAGQHQSHMLSATGYVRPYDMPAFSTYDASAGVARGSWTAQIFGQNLTDVNSSLATNSQQFVTSEITQRPRVLGIRFTYQFAEK